MIRALLWDHDGVLVDTEGLYFAATREVLATVGVELTETLYQRYFLIEGSGVWHIARERGVPDVVISTLKEKRAALYNDLLLRSDVLSPLAHPVLASLCGRFRMCIVTSSHGVHFATIHRSTALSRYFEFILTREDYQNAKPHPEPYLTAVARLGLHASECLVIEDSERGLRAALAAGIRCWVMPSALTNGCEFDGAERRFDGLEDLCEGLAALP